MLSMAVIPLSSLPSAIPEPELRAANRIDPFYGGLWERSSNAIWLSADLAHRQEDAGLGRVPKWLASDPSAILDSMRDTRRRPTRLAAAAAIDTWRTLASDQLGAISGRPELATPRPPAIAELFAAGILDIGMYDLGLAGAADRGHLFRPSRTSFFDDHLAPGLTWPEWVSVTGGSPWSSSSQYDRHNLAVAELALRAAEFCEVGAVTGEKHSTFNNYAHEGVGRPRRRGLQRAADATIVRTDGLRIAVEFTASLGGAFAKKIRGWAEFIHRNRLQDTGLVVVFVVAKRHENKVGGAEIAKQVRTQLANAARDYPGVRGDQTGHRMFYADLADWFPSAHTASAEFLTLECERPSGDTVETRWQRAALLDVIDVPFEPGPGFNPLALVDNLRLLRSTPYWLRGGQRRELWPEPVKTLGFRRLPKLQTQLPLGSAKGVAGITRPPTRLLVS